MNAVTEQAPTGNTSRPQKSVAVLGLALSFGASGVLFADSEATAAVGSFTNSAAAPSELAQFPSVLNNQLSQPSAKVYGSAIYHTVEQGDSLWQIAREHQVEIQDIKVANRISPDAPLQVGQVIKVPGEEVTQPTVVSLLPGVQTRLDAQAHQPSLERLLAGIPDSSLVEVSQQPEVDDAAVVAAEELTGDTSLRSAGLVSQSDGFQADLEQLATTARSTGRTPLENVQVDAASSEMLNEESSSDSVSAAYEVRSGDTVGDIALSLGTTSEELLAVNDLEDPDFIVVGETLSVPEDVANELVIAEAIDSLEQVAPNLTASSGIGGFDGTRLSRLQSTVENRIDASQTLQRLRVAREAVELQTADAQADIVVVEDPYTADLLAEVSSAQQLSAPESADEQIALNQPVLDVETVVNPQFRGDGLESGAMADDTASRRPELLAAAPLDPSVYVATPAPAAGQVVSPEMPILPSADEYLPEAPDYFNGYIWPTRGTLTSGYGWRWGRMHRGIDVAGPVGTPIVSAAPGIVEKAGWNSGGYGNMVEVRHADGSMTRYAHNSRIVVRVGETVTQGQHIADMGSTGYSTGPHLHFEVHLPERGTVNPMAMLPSR